MSEFYERKPIFSMSGISPQTRTDVGLGYAQSSMSADLDVDVKIPKVDVSPGVTTDGAGKETSILAQNIGAIGTFASVIGSIMANREQNKFSKKVYRDEKARADREEARASKFRSDFGKGW